MYYSQYMLLARFRYTLTHLALVCVLLSVPFVAEAQYKPLVEGLGIPGLSGTPTIAGVVNGLFNLALVLGSVLAVLIIAGSGLQYMSTDAVFQKKDSVYRMSYAILGLLMLLGTWLFFNEINPNILNLTISATQTSGGVSTQRADTTNTSRVVNGSVTGTIRTTPVTRVDPGTLSSVSDPNLRNGICGTAVNGTGVHYCGYTNTQQCTDHLGSNAGCGTYTLSSGSVTTFSAECDQTNGTSCVSQLENYDFYAVEVDPSDQSKRIFTFFKTQQDCVTTYATNQCTRDTSIGSVWQRRMDSGRAKIRLQ